MYDLNEENAKDAVEFLKMLNKMSNSLKNDDQIASKKQLLIFVRSLLNYQREKPSLFDSDTHKTLISLNGELYQDLKNLN